MSALPPILIVDDEPDDLFVVRRLLAKAGVGNKVVSIEDPLGAIDYLELESHNPNPLFLPCVVFTDLNMPGKSGLELTAWIRAHPVLKDLRVVMVTDSENPDDEGRAKRAGVTRYLRKFPTSHGLKLLVAAMPCSAI